ncbi:hypothetical protein DYBT9275_03899 [Dyadobacter sp. CECT 9275]|uniref:Error-prone repair protein ImuA n=1 Tax=Dyadobacter helix TaxID=2822344 RepID=A0A916NMI4_9BACT|nr:Error-prone repair protein ImuA [Dyadobacter sp. CECT 9275]CAG5006803.1 hypothetical protein DYBT9275_03899 [Dyadobacter sp. CECT 9275]
MKTQAEKSEMIARLQSDILSLQGFRTPSLDMKQDSFGLGPVASAFPGGVFPTAGIHEFISQTPQQSAATSGFMAALAGNLMRGDGICVWVGTKRTIYPLALTYFGVSADHVIFIDLKKEKDLLWVIEEALKCTALSAVVGEIKELNLTESRRLQLTIEENKSTGLLHRVSPRLSNPTAAVCRWQISPVQGLPQHILPGIGFPRWQVTIQKVRSGEPGSWQLEWNQDHFEHITAPVTADEQYLSRVG